MLITATKKKEKFCPVSGLDPIAFRKGWDGVKVRCVAVALFGVVKLPSVGVSSKLHQQSFTDALRIA